jgi:hypothetical protein
MRPNSVVFEFGHFSGFNRGLERFKGITDFQNVTPEQFAIFGQVRSTKEETLNRRATLDLIAASFSCLSLVEPENNVGMPKLISIFLIAASLSGLAIASDWKREVNGRWALP